MQKQQQQADQEVIASLPLEHQQRVQARFDAKDAETASRVDHTGNRSSSGQGQKLQECLRQYAGQAVLKYNLEGTVCEAIGTAGLLGARQGAARHLQRMGCQLGSVHGESAWMVPEQLQLQTDSRLPHKVIDYSEDLEI